MSEMHLARLCFDPSGGDQIDTEGWTTVFTLGGLTLPDVATARDDYSYEQRLSVALLYLVSQFARRLMNGLDRRTPKAIFLDEAWAITSTPEGAKLVPEVSRMGRSRNTALVLVSQNAGDLLNEQVTNCLSSVFAFRSTERVEVEHVLELLGVDPNEEHKGRAALAAQRRVRLPRPRRTGGPDRRRPDLRGGCCAGWTPIRRTPSRMRSSRTRWVSGAVGGSRGRVRSRKRRVALLVLVIVTFFVVSPVIVGSSVAQRRRRVRHVVRPRRRRW